LSLDDLLKYSVPRGWFVPVTPGTRFVTIGGMVASDVHGKNHHVDGSFGSHVVALDVELSDGATVTLSPTNNAGWFWATVGGMGLTGIVRRVTFRMIRIESSLVEVETTRFRNLESGLKLMSDQSDDSFRYSVAWIDISARGKNLGRGVLTRGDHAPAFKDPRKDRLRYQPNVRLAVPPVVPNWFLNSLTIKLFNELWYRKSPRRQRVDLESIPKFFHPLDGVRMWNRVYGRRGFIQYQIIVPYSHTDLLKEIVTEFSRERIGSFLAVLKRMGPQNVAPMSFPTEGWTLTVDIASGTPGLPELLARLDERVLASGGRHYLAKDAHVTSQAVSRGYARLEEWKRTRQEMDPSSRWKSDLGRRLGLVE
jgi:decaprenylphospho-beta-D-ribofuranose 2-oxidase